MNNYTIKVTYYAVYRIYNNILAGFIETSFKQDDPNPNYFTNKDDFIEVKDKLGYDLTENLIILNYLEIKREYIVSK